MFAGIGKRLQKWRLHSRNSRKGRMKELLTALIALGFGFVTAIPVGATQIEIAKRSLNRQLKAALMVSAGSVASDMLYGFLALYGIAPFFNRKIVLGGFEAMGAVLLWILGILTLRESGREKILSFNNGKLGGKRLSFVTGFSLAITNPMMIFWWLIGMHCIADLDLIDHHGKLMSLIFLMFGGLGLGAYLTLLASTLYKINRFITENAMQRIYVVLGFGLFLFSIYFLFQFIQTVA